MEKKAFGEDSEERNFLRKVVDIEFKASKRDFQILEAHRENLESWGWKFIRKDRIEEEEKEANATPLSYEQQYVQVVASQPEIKIWLSQVPVIEGVEASLDDFRSFLVDLEESSSRRIRPKCFSRIINYRACRGAIMFGTELSRTQCEEILKGLCKCRLPFSCAHGRPSMIPLISIPSSNKKAT